MAVSDRIMLELTSADMSGCLHAYNEAGVRIYELTSGDDPLTCRFSVEGKTLAVVEKITEKRGSALRRVRTFGWQESLRPIVKRPVLCLGLLFFFVLTLWLPTRVLFVRVVGNDRISDNEIISAAEGCGIHFGASRREIRSEKVKNALLEAMPELQWAGINTAGCVATVQVREKQIDGGKDLSGAVSSLIASRDGVISSITVERGSGMCTVGQVVKEGQVLISGYTDCGLTIRATRASGEIFAETNRSLTVVSPSVSVQRSSKTDETEKISLIFGKKRINLYKGSGISPGSCVKMYSESYLTLPGGFQLPVGLVTETWTEQKREETFDSRLCEDPELFARRYLSCQMVAGQILNSRVQIGDEDGVVCLLGEYACREMIGKVRNEEIIDRYGN